MRYKDLFPYTNRCLGLAHLKTEHEDRRNPAWLAKIAISNLQKGDRIAFPAGNLSVNAVSDVSIELVLTKADGSDVPILLEKDHLDGHNVTESFAALIEAVGPDYKSDISPIIERDPTIFRLRTKEGWIANDKLCLMAGNVQYAISAVSEPEEQAMETAAQPSSAPLSPVQSGFDFG